MKTIYTDNNATTPVAPEVVEVIQRYLTEQFFNPSSMYSEAAIPSDAMASARQEISNCLGSATADQILFTSCATESNNTAIFGAIQARPKRRHIITTEVEHPSVLEVCREAERRGCEVTFVPVNADGALDIGAFVRALRPDTLLVSIMHANNETGVVFPIEDLSRITKETDKDIIFHTDATQTIGKLKVNLSANLKYVDMLSFSGHKLHGPKGIGALYIKRGTPCRPLIYGGHQEKGRRGGTENVAFIAGLGVACRLAVNALADENRVEVLRNKLQTSLKEAIPYIEVNGENSPRLPNTLNLAVHSVEGESILYQLGAKGICASSGSACTSGSLDPSHVLKAMNLPFTAIHGSVRFSLSRYTTEEEIGTIIETFPEIIANLRRLSPFWNQKEECPKDMG